VLFALASLAALALAAGETADVPANDPALVACMAHASNTGRFRAIASDELGDDETFLDSVEGSWCSDEASNYWSLAHQEARAELGLPEEGLPGPGQQELAEANMHRMLGEAWASAAALRADPPRQSEEERDRFLLVWNLDNMGEDTAVGLASKPAILCAASALKDNPLLIRKMAERGGSIDAASIDRAYPSCGYGQAVGQVAALTAEGLPGYADDEYRQMAEQTLGTMLFYASIAQGN
jgi:hypothetical protein